MNACSRQPLPREIGGEKVCVLFGLDEDQSPLLGIALGILHQLLQFRALLKLGNLVEVLNKSYLSCNTKYSRIQYFKERNCNPI